MSAFETWDLVALAAPKLDGEWKEFWEATARGELLIQACPHCNARQFYPRMLCMACGREPQWLKTGGRGTLHTYSVVRQNMAAPFKDMVPYVNAMVELEEGPRMMTNITHAEIDTLRVGMPLVVHFAQQGPGCWLPYWRPAD